MSKTTRSEDAVVSVRVQPRARRDEIVGWQGCTLRVRVTAPPVDGRANDAVIGVLAAAFGVPRSSVGLVSGAASQCKLFRVAQHSLDDLRAILARRSEDART
jgi:uncharacterized protein (TIGR00251 family)